MEYLDLDLLEFEVKF